MKARNGNRAEVTFFGLYEAKEGDLCSNFMRDNFHKILMDSPLLLTNFREAILRSLHEAQKRYFDIVGHFKNEKFGGCCSITILMTIGKKSNFSKF